MSLDGLANNRSWSLAAWNGRPNSSPEPTTPTETTNPLPPFSTPRSAKKVGDGHKQVNLRTLVGIEMDNEVLECSVGEFLNHYAPFRPSDASVEDVLKMFQTDLSGPLMKKVQRSGKERKGKGKKREESKEEVDAEFVWADFDQPPSQMDGSESRIFGALQDIVNALVDVKCTDERGVPRTCLFEYQDCPSEDMFSEIPGTTFRVDARVTNRPPGRKVILSDTPVIAEFKEKRSPEYIEQNRLRLVSAAGQIMNDDPCRMFTYGITIEDNMMALWYFSRSHSVKSCDFDFTKDHKTFTWTFLSFLFATREEIGYDPTVSRVMFMDKIRYVYRMGSEAAPEYYRTTGTLYNQRVLCISGRKTRVWKVVRVAGPTGDDLGQIIGDEVVLKDVWLDKGAKTEGEILRNIFQDITNFESPQSNFHYLPTWLQERFRDIIKTGSFKSYFMTIESEWQGTLTKLVSVGAKKVTGLFKQRTRKDSRGNVLSSSTQGFSGYLMPSNLGQNVDIPTVNFERKYGQRRQYRLIYKEVGMTLSTVPNQQRACKVFQHLLFSLGLLFVAGWIHRDISPNNVYCIVKDGGLRGVLSDFEYARKFGAESSSGEPKTGTPYFMAIEVHDADYIFKERPKVTLRSARKIPEEAGFDPLMDIVPTKAPNSLPPGAERKMVMFRFQHDLESVWWIMLWFVTLHIKHDGSQTWAKDVFQYSFKPSSYRREVFTKPGRLVSGLRGCIHDNIQGCVRPLDEMRKFLVDSYLDPVTFKKMAASEPYADVYVNVYQVALDFLSFLLGSEDIPLDLPDSQADTAGQPKVKRPRPSTQGTKGDDEYVPDAEEQARRKSKRAKRKGEEEHITTALAPRMHMRGLS